MRPVTSAHFDAIAMFIKFGHPNSQYILIF